MAGRRMPGISSIGHFKMIATTPVQNLRIRKVKNGFLLLPDDLSNLDFLWRNIEVFKNFDELALSLKEKLEETENQK